LKATEQPIDTSTAAGKCFLDMLGVFAEFETEGIAKAKAAGVYKGRPASIDVTKVRDRQGPEDRSRLRLQSAWRARVVGGRRHKLGHKRCRRRQHLFASLEEIAQPRC
jgi:DNA invertase Pin-like site-specific DNA recombinase